jgi:hypothetical protein
MIISKPIELDDLNKILVSLFADKISQKPTTNSNINEKSDNDDTTKNVPVGEDTQQEQDNKKGKILCFYPNKIVIHIYERVLKSYDYEVEATTEQNIFIDKLKSNEFDIALFDGLIFDGDKDFWNMVNTLEIKTLVLLDEHEKQGLDYSSVYEGYSKELVKKIDELLHQA